MISITVCGTSNAIFSDGYVKGLTDASSVIDVKRAVLGASGSLIYPYFRDSIKGNSSDWVILETAVNDLVMGRTGETSADIVRVALDNAVADTLIAGKMPCIVIFPHLSVVRHGSPVRSVYDEIIDKYSVPYLDVYELIEDGLHQLHSSAVEDLFRDASHLHPTLARAIGKWLGSELLSFKHSFSNQSSESLPIVLNHIPASSFAPGYFLRNQIATSLIKSEYVTIRRGEKLQLPDTKSDVLIGIVYDAARSVGSLKVGTPDKVAISGSVSDAYYIHGTSLRIAAFPNSTAECRPAFFMEIVDELDDKRQANWLEGLKRCEQATLNLAGIITMHEAPARKVPILADGAVNLLREASESSRQSLSLQLKAIMNIP